jgi:hypothetical protein
LLSFIIFDITSGNIDTEAKSVFQDGNIISKSYSENSKISQSKVLYFFQINDFTIFFHSGVVRSITLFFIEGDMYDIVHFQNVNTFATSPESVRNIHQLSCHFFIQYFNSHHSILFGLQWNKWLFTNSSALLYFFASCTSDSDNSIVPALLSTTFGTTFVLFVAFVSISHFCISFGIYRYSFAHQSSIESITSEYLTFFDITILSHPAYDLAKSGKSVTKSQGFISFCHFTVPL